MKAYINLARNILLSNFNRLAFPYKLTFALTYRCNYRCKTCNIWKREAQDELSLHEIESFFRTSNRFNWIDFTGGEVWLRRDFESIAEAAIRHCKNLVMMHFPTNGFMTERIVRGTKEIMKMKPRKLVVSISMDGDESGNDLIRGVTGGWRRQIETYKRLHAIPGVDVFLGMTLSAFNVDQYDSAFAAARQECPWLTPADFHMNIAHESVHYYGNQGNSVLVRDREALAKQIDRYRRLRGMHLNPIAYIERSYLKHVGTYLASGTTPMRCHALFSSCFIDPAGDVYPCGMYAARVAALRDHSYDLCRIWNLERTTQLQREIWQYQCPHCWTPCEAYQSILGNLLGTRNTPVKSTATLKKV